jgi:hypothetical protein
MEATSWSKRLSLSSRFALQVFQPRASQFA